MRKKHHNFQTHIYHVFSGKNKDHLDLGRILWGCGVLVFFALSIHSVWTNHPFDPMQWGSGFACVLAAGGAALMMKKGDEPEERFGPDGVVYRNKSGEDNHNSDTPHQGA